MKMTVGGQIILEGLTPKQEAEIKKALEIPDPKYRVALRRNPKAKFWLSPVIKYYEKQGPLLLIGRGLRSRIEAYCRINHIDLETVETTVSRPERFTPSTIVLRPYQEGVPERLAQKLEGIVRLDTAYGKGQTKSSAILTPTGWRTIGQIKVGSKVIGADGLPHKVIGVYPQGIKDIYEINFSDGTKAYCDEDHLWAVRTRTQKFRNQNFQVKTVKELKKSIARDWQIPLVKPIEFDPLEKLVVDPYVLGVLLGDGSFRHNVIRITQQNRYVIEEVKKRLGDQYKLTRAGRYSYRIVRNKAKESFPSLISHLGLDNKLSWEKFIPEVYLRSSPKERLQLIQGLMDTDGTINKLNSGPSFSSSSTDLAKGFSELVRSLGGTAKVRIKKNIFYTYRGRKLRGRPSTTVSINLKPLSPFLAHSKRLKRSKKNKSNYLPTKVIRSIKRKGREETVCIKIDTLDGLYLTDGYTVTHNTIIALALAERLGQKTLIIVPRIEIMNQFIEEYEKYFPLSQPIGIIQGSESTRGSITVGVTASIRKRVASGELKADEFGCLIVDECHLAVAPGTSRLLGFFCPKHLYGFTATADRSDGQGEAIKFLFGPIIKDGVLSRTPPTVKLCPYVGQFHGFEYAQIITNQIEDPKRNAFIANEIHEAVKQKRKVLVLTKRIEHYKAIAALLPDLSTFSIESSLSVEKRKELMAKLREQIDCFQVILGTFSLLSTGINIPNLDTLVFAGDLKSAVLTQQSAGRILRLFVGKHPPLIIDILDVSNTILYRQARRRQQCYKSLKWPII